MVEGSAGKRAAAKTAEPVEKLYPQDPLLFPAANLHHMPPTRFLPHERDKFSQPSILKAGNQSQLIVFEGRPRCFWNNNALAELHEAVEYMADFFERELGTRR